MFNYRTAAQTAPGAGRNCFSYKGHSSYRKVKQNSPGELKEYLKDSTGWIPAFCPSNLLQMQSRHLWNHGIHRMGSWNAEKHKAHRFGLFLGSLDSISAQGMLSWAEIREKNGIFRRFQEFCSWNTAEEATKWLDLMIFEAFFNLNDSNQWFPTNIFWQQDK